MNFRDHSKLEGKHAFLSASGYHWVNYSEDKLVETWHNYMAAEQGTKLHALACQLIKMNVKLPKSKKSLNMFVNDGIGFKMTPEQPLFYSENCFGTADAISFNGDTLRIHDYKSGKTPASMMQLRVYAALFCLEYNQKPSEFETILRIYQFDDINEERSEVDQIVPIMDKIVTFDKIISRLTEEEA